MDGAILYTVHSVQYFIFSPFYSLSPLPLLSFILLFSLLTSHISLISRHWAGNKLSRQETHVLQVQLWESLRGGLKELSKLGDTHAHTHIWTRTHAYSYIRTCTYLRWYEHAHTFTCSLTHPLTHVDVCHTSTHLHILIYITITKSCSISPYHSI